MNTNQEHYDIIIVGTGAGGGTVAHELAPTGKKDLASRARRVFYPVKKIIGNPTEVYQKPTLLY